MGIQFQFPAQVKIAQALAPATDAAGRSGAWVKLTEAPKLYVVAHITQGNAATVALTFQQAQDTAGTGAKALSGNVRIWANQDTSVNDTLVAQTSATSFTTSAAVKNKIVVFEIEPRAALDINNGFNSIQVITGASNVANITEALYFAPFPNFQQATPPTIVA